MKRKAKTFALLALGTIIVLGLLSWRFPSSFPFTRSETEIFVEAFGRGDFERCYSMMGDEFRAAHSESHFVRLWDKKVGIYGFRMRLGPYKGITRLAFSLDATLLYEIQYANGELLVLVETRDGDENSSIEEVRLHSLRRGLPPTPTPMPDQGPIS